MRRRYLWIVIGILSFAALFRVAVVHWLPNDTPGDGIVYAQMARNVLEQHVYSHDTQPPYNPSLVRLPGYPLFMAAVYSIFGHTNNGAVRFVQALIDAATCGLVALLAFLWQPDKKKKRASAIAALALAAICPFTTIYAATILTEVPTNFLMIAMFVAATFALRNGFTTEDTEEGKRKNLKGSILWWMVAGLTGGVSVFFRPDNGLFVAAVGLTLVVTGLTKIFPSAIGRGARGEALARKPQPQPSPSGGGRDTDPKRHRGFALMAHSKRVLAQTLLCGAVFSISFAFLLVPWTIRNWRIFHLFQPLAPAHAEMPGEFVPRGYSLWLRTWLDDDRYIAPFLWSLDTDPIDVDDIPPYAFDSPDEKNRVSALFDKYNNRYDTLASQVEPRQPNPTPTPQASASPTDKKNSSGAKQSQQNSNANAAENSDGENENSEESGDEESEKEQHGPVEMTPEIDAGFTQIARERIARHRFQFYLLLPLKRARTMWFDTHSQYWPFEGTLLPFEDLDFEGHQQYWLPLFAGLTALYTLFGFGGAWALWNSGEFESRQWVLLVTLAVVLRLILFSSIENPEPRYLVEFFPILSVLGGVFVARMVGNRSPQDGS